MKHLVLATLLVSSVTFANGNSAKGKKIYKKINCASCHKKDGMGKAKKKKDGTYKLGGTFAPRIAGLDQSYIIEQMNAIKSKTRKTKYTASMKVKIKKLTEQDIADVAAYVANDLAKKSGKYKSEIWPRK